MKKRISEGFTIIELLIVVVVVAILAAIVIVAYNGIQAKGRDVERQTDIKAIAQALEAYYIDNDHYPPFSQPGPIGLNVAAWRTANLPGISDAVVTAPGAISVALVNSATPTVNQYGYRNGEGCVKCSRFFLYWRSEVDNHVETIVSMNGQ